MSAAERKPPSPRQRGAKGWAIEVRYRGHRRNATLPTPQAAIAWWYIAVESIDEHDYCPIPDEVADLIADRTAPKGTAPRLRFDEVLERHYEQAAAQAARQGHRVDSVENKIGGLRRVGKWLTGQNVNYWDEITPDVVEDLNWWLAEDPGISFKTGKNHVSWLRQMGRTAQKMGLDDPFAGDALEVPTRKRSGTTVDRSKWLITWREIVELASHMPAQWCLFILLPWACGLRPGEVFGLRVQDWDPETRTLYIHSQGGRRYKNHTRISEDEAHRLGDAAVKIGRWWYRKDVVRFVDTTKTAAGIREVPVPPTVAKIINEYISEFHPGASPDSTDRLLVHPDPTKTADDQNAPRYWLRKAVQATGIGEDRPGLSVNAQHLRRCFLTTLFRGIADQGDASRFKRTAALVTGHKVEDIDREILPVAAAHYDLHGINLSHLDACAAVVERVIEESGTTFEFTTGSVPWGGDDWLDTTEVSELLGLTASMVHKRMRRPGFPVRIRYAPGPKFDPQVLFHKDDLIAYREMMDRLRPIQDLVEVFDVDYFAVLDGCRHADVRVYRWDNVAQVDSARLDDIRDAIVNVRGEPDGTVSAAHAARRLGITENRIRVYILQGHLEDAGKRGRSQRITTASLELALKKQANGELP